MELRVLNLPKSFTRQELIALCKPHGAIASCDLVMDPKSGLSKGFGFVTFRDADAAQAAITALHGKKIGGSKIRVKPADQPAA